MGYGKIVVIEGLDGSGKRTQAELLSSKLSELSLNNIVVSFPDYSSLSSSLVKMYLNSEFGSNPEDVNAYAASSFFAVDRYASYMSKWKENFQRGDIIISDRYTTSNAVYQMTKLNPKDWEDYINWIYDYEYNKLGLPCPSIVIYLDMPIDCSQELMDRRYKDSKGSKDMHESNKGFLENCYNTSKYISQRDKWHVIKCFENGNIKSREDIEEEIFDIIKEGIINEA